MIFERVTKENALEASHIYDQGWKQGFAGIVPQSYLDALSEERWAPILIHSPYKGFILKDGGRYVATSSVFSARDEEMSGWGEIVTMYVHPQYFRKGYGKALFSHVVEQLRADGFDRIYLWVFEQNQRARAFYEAMGFRPNGDKKISEIGGENLVEVRYVNAL